MKINKIYLAIAIYFIWLAVFAIYSYQKADAELLSTIDARLKSAAYAIPNILPENFHYKEMSKTSVSKEQDLELLKALNEYAEKSDVFYLYSLIMQDNKLLFTSANATEQDLKDNGGNTFYFYPYDDADSRIYDIFHHKKITFINVEDQWGKYRSVFIPLQAKDGTTYIVGADISTEYISSLLNTELYQTIIISLLFILFAIPFFLAFTSESRQWVKNLEALVQKRTASLSENEKRLRLAMGMANQGWFDLNTQTGELLVSAEYPKLLGYSTSEFHLNFEQWKQNIHPDDIDSVLDMLQSCIKSAEPKEVEYRQKTKDGNWLWLKSVGEIIEWDKEHKPIRMIGIHADITKSKRQQEKLESIAHYDVLTGLPNRVLFTDRFKQVMAHSRRNKSKLAICFLDLDGFKPINDTYGHEIGDQLLIQLSKRLKAEVREEDTVARYGGDEFILLLGNLGSMSEFKKMLERIHHTVSQPYLLNNNTHKITISTGITIYPSDDCSMDTLIQHADESMYKAKLAGGNQFYFFNESYPEFSLNNDL